MTEGIERERERLIDAWGVESGGKLMMQSHDFSTFMQVKVSREALPSCGFTLQRDKDKQTN